MQMRKIALAVATLFANDSFEPEPRSLVVNEHCSVYLPDCWFVP